MSDQEFHPADEWIDADREWDEIAPWLLDEVIEDFINEAEAGGYI
jgi:hypothetical protein